MTKRAVTTISGAAVAAAVFTLATLPVAGQGGGASTSTTTLAEARAIAAKAPPLVITAYNGGPAIDYTMPRTPWGEPDLQGVWSSDDTANIPTDRPQNLGEQLYLDDEAFAERVQRIEGGLERLDNETGSFRNDYASRAFRQTSQIVDPPNGRRPAFTAFADTRRAPRDQGTFGNGPLDWTTDFTLYDRCITRGIVGSTLRVIYGNGNRIVQGPNMVALSYEMVHDTRVIYTDGRPFVNNSIRQYLGNSRGWWEGDTLVVVTTNLTDQTSIGLNGNGLRHSDQMTLVERIRRVADDIIQYQVTVDDPITYEAPFTYSIPWTPLIGGMLMPYECHEGNHAISNALSAERTEDRLMAEAAAKGIPRERRGIQASGAGGGGGGRGGRGRGAGAGGRGGGRGAPPAVETGGEQ